MKSKKVIADKKVWVEVEVNKYTDGITVFRGQMRKSELEAWSRGELVDCAIKLERTYWFSGSNICILGKGENNAVHYTGETFLKVDTVMLIFVLREDSFPDQASPNKGNIFPFPGRPKQ